MTAEMATGYNPGSTLPIGPIAQDK